MNKIVCRVCKDTHEMWISSQERSVMCTHCPVPCTACAIGSRGEGAYCQVTPCNCICHPENKDEIMIWYIGPLTKEHIAKLRYQLAKTRGLLTSFIDWESSDPKYLPPSQNILDILKDTKG